MRSVRARPPVKTILIEACLTFFFKINLLIILSISIFFRVAIQPQIIWAESFSLFKVLVKQKILPFTIFNHVKNAVAS